jgi:hypothetical protein
VISVDIDHDSPVSSELRLSRRQRVPGDSRGRQGSAAEARHIRDPRLGHRRDHVLRELGPMSLCRAALPRGRDSCVNGHPVRPEFGPRPMERSRNSESDRCSSRIAGAREVRLPSLKCTKNGGGLWDLPKSTKYWGGGGTTGLLQRSKCYGFAPEIRMRCIVKHLCVIA